MLRLCPYLQDASTTILHSKILEGLHGVKLSAYARLTFVLRQLLPLAILFLTLLDRLTLASLLSQSPRILAWVGFHLL
jgi:hypothetical protein